MLEAARSVVIIPGYGMAVAQAQHAVKELATALERNGTGFSGLENRLFFHTNTRMLYGDAKATVSALVAEFPK